MYRFPVAIFLLLYCLSAPLWAATSSRDVVNPPSGIHITAREAYDMKIANPDKVILLDVRSQAEVRYTGIADQVDANIPYRFDTTRWKMKGDGVHGTYRTAKNPDFAAAVKNLVARKNLTLEDPVIIMCKGGTRAPWAAKALYRAGFTTVYTQGEGFEGIKAKTGPDKGKRVVDGWKNEGLPWSYDLVADKMYFNFAPGQDDK